ncbi:MAG: hypothetical protein IPM22_03720 [Betaproteobacteria bacterium]|nr:hypothetical protein [Betaproteobacteria bacterium]
MSLTRLAVVGFAACMACTRLALAQPAPMSGATGAKVQPAAAGAQTVAPAGETAAKKTFNESRSNNTRSVGGASGSAPAGDAAAKKTFNESRSNNTRTAGVGQPAPGLPGGSTLQNAAPPAAGSTTATSTPK